jgi:phosphoribosylanthranilate isomerase
LRSLSDRPRLKVCCISSVAEAETAIRHGADAIGLVSAMPSGPGVIPDDLIEKIVASIPSGISTVLLTSSRDVDVVVQQQSRFNVDTLQLCNRWSSSGVEQLRAALPGVSIMQVVHVMDGEAIEQAREAARTADVLLLDSGNPKKKIQELGGTGRTHDWTISRRIRDAVEVPIFLAGGLTPNNVADAVRQVRPFGVDVCSGLRTGGNLDQDKLGRFVANLEKAG